MPIKSVEFPGKIFETKEELFTALKDHKDDIIELKKAVKYSHATKACITIGDPEDAVRKALEVIEGNSLHVINTTNIVDSHNDMHVNGLWAKSIKEQRGKTFFLADHDMSISSVIAFPKDVKMRTLTTEWKELGFDFEGSTQALVFEINKDKVVHSGAKRIIDNNIEIEHSIRMAYVKIELAINSDDPDFKAEKEIWDKFFPRVANKEDAEERGFMWIVKEARIHQEGSMVLKGSNHATPMIVGKGLLDDDEPIKEGEKEENKDEVSKISPFLV